MNFGTQAIRDVIYNNVKKAGYKGGIAHGKFAKDTADLIWKLIEAEMNPDMKAQARARGIPDAVLDFSERAGKALGLSMMQLDEVSQDAYKWIMEQEAQGQTIEAFADWARKDEQGKYMGKYRKGAGNIRNDWARAFTSVKPEFIVSADDIR